MANINIGGRLHSSATGNVVSGANEILDDTKGKKQDVINAEVDEALAGKQGTISDLSTIRSGAAAGATAYQKPGTGIPKSDTASDVQTSLGKADTAYQKPSGGIPKSDTASGVQQSLDLADSAIQADPIGTIVPPVDPSEFATQEEVSQLQHIVTTLAGKFYGVFDDDSDLPEGDIVGYAFVGTAEPLALYTFDGEDWTDTEIAIAGIVGPPGPQGVQGVQGNPGPAGVTSVVASVDTNTGVPSVDVALNSGVLTLTFHNLKGVQGNTGSSVDYPFVLVNNLTDGGVDKGLTAEMGKYLGQSLFGVEEEETISVSNYTKTGYSINSQGVWRAYNGSTMKGDGIMIPLTNCSSVKMITTGNIAIAFLKSNTQSDGATPDYSTSYSSRITVNGTETYTIPADTHYLFINTNIQDGTDVTSRISSITATINTVGAVFKNQIVDNLVSDNDKAPLSAKQGKVLKGLIDSKAGGVLAGKKVAIIGDSISTIYGFDTPYWTVKAVDVGETIQSYVTWQDVYGNYAYPDTSHPTNKTIGGVTLTASMIDGELHSFTPVAGDVGKEIGVPRHYSGNTASVDVWSKRLCDATGATLLANASWSGSAITSVLNDGGTAYKVGSQAWHPCTIGRCRVRDDEGNFIEPDVIIIYRGTNDFSYANNGSYPTLQITDVDLTSGFSATTDKVADHTYSFRTGYYMAIQALRTAYPNAIIVLCTLNVFKRVTYDKWPTRNDAFTLPDINNVIREIADITGCGLIELDKDGITFQNCYPTYISDSSTTPTHPNTNGHRVMAEKALADLTYVLNPTE